MQNKNLLKYVKKLSLTFVLIFIGLSFFIRPVKNVEKSTDYSNIDFKDNKYGLYLSSFRAEIIGDYFNLNKKYSDAVSQNQNDFLGKSYIIDATNGNEKEAIESAKKEVKQNPSNVIPSIYLSYIDFKNDRYDDALSKLNNIKNKSETFMVKLLKSWILFAQDKNDEALDLLETEINNPAFDNIILVNLGTMAELYGDYEYAEELYEEALTTKLTLFDIETIANFYINQNRKQRAIEIVSDYYKDAPQSTSAYSLLKSIENDTYKPFYIDTPKKAMGKALFDISNVILALFPSATDLYLMYVDMVLNLEPNFYIAQLMKAEIFKKHNKAKEYETIVKTVPETHYLNLINKMNYAQFLLKNDKQKSIAIYTDLISQNPDILQLYKNVGDYYKETKNYNTAIKYYTDGIEQKQDNKTLNAELYFARAITYDSLNDMEKSKKDLEQSVILNPKNPVVLNYYAYFLLMNDTDFERAFKLSEQAIAYEPLNPYYLDTYGWAYFKLGKFEDALKMMEYAKAINPTNSIIIDHLGDIYWTVGRKREAKYEWKKALTYLNTTKINEANDDLSEIRLNNKINFGI